MLTTRTDSTNLNDASNITRPVSATRRPASQRIHRACDRCRVKKSKCNGQQPCNTCSLNQRTCVFSALRRRDIRKWHCRMQDTVDEAIQRLYRACKANGCFPGIPPSRQDGHATTEDILIAMGFGSVGLSPVPGALPSTPAETRVDNNYIENHGPPIDKRVFLNGNDESLSNPPPIVTAPPHQSVIHHISPGVYEPFQHSFAVTPESAIDQSHEALPRWTSSEPPQPQRYHHHYQHDSNHRQHATQTQSIVNRQSVPYINVHTLSSNDVSPRSFTFDSHDSYLVPPYVVYSNGLFVEAQQAWPAHNTLLSVQQ